MTNIILAAIAAACVGFIGWLITREIGLRDFRAGERAQRRGDPLDAGWCEAKQQGWSKAWGEQLRARLGQRG